MSEIERNTWLRALAIIEQWVLSPEDEANDNSVPQQDGDGTAHNNALRCIRKRYEEELAKSCLEVQESELGDGHRVLARKAMDAIKEFQP